MICRQLNSHACQTYLVGLENSQDVFLIDPVLDHFQDYLVPIGNLTHRMHEIAEHKDGGVVAVCLSGARAHTAAQILTKAGFPDVTVLAGGMIAWKSWAEPIA
jgi:rhodanese-related sulfurtransferase